MNLGQRLAALRTAKGISQTFVANSLYKTPQWLSNIEKGRRNIGAVELNDVAQILGVNVSAFLNDKDYNKALNDINNNQPTGTDGS
jgi:transcriptional regulator with XRE-family HTH domain